FLAEGLPAVVLGLAVLAYLPDGPASASWLTPEERRSLAARLGPEQEIEAHHAATLGAALADRRVWRLAVLYFVLVTGLYGVGLWLPQIVQSLSGLGDVMVGIVSAVPYVVAAAGMVLVGRQSARARRGARRGGAARARRGAALSAAGSREPETCSLEGHLVGCVEAGGWVSLVREAPVEVGVYAAKTHLSPLLDRAARGDEVVITRNGKPIARLVPVERRRPPRKLGALRG